MFCSLHDCLVLAVREYWNCKHASLLALAKHIVGEAYLGVAISSETIMEKGSVMRKEVEKENDSCKPAPFGSW